MRFVEGASNAALNLSSASGMVEVLKERDNNALAGLSVPVGVVDRSHGVIVISIFNQPHSRRDDGPSIRTDELDGTSSHRFGPLGYRSHHEHRFAQRRGLLLHAAA